MIQSNNVIFNTKNINFNGGNISSEGGIILLLEYIRKAGILSYLKNMQFNDHRKLIIHSNISIIYQMIIRIFLGYFAQSGQEVLQNDPLLAKYISPCSQSTVSRLYDRINRHTTIHLKEINQVLACNYINHHVDDIVLDVDSTNAQTYGSQEASAYIHHYALTGYHPIMINEYNSKLLVSSSLRCGNSYSSNGFIEEMKEVMTHIDNENKTIKVRGDSAFYSKEYLEYMEDNCIQYYIRCKSFSKLSNHCFEDMISKGIDFTDHTPDKPYYGECEYTITGSKKSRRVVYKAYRAPEKDGATQLFPTVYSVVTNDCDLSPVEVMDFYEERGNSENFTKELKDDFNGGTLSHDTFIKNEFDFLLSSLAYNIYHLFQLDILEGNDHKIRMNTYRMKYEKIAVKVISHARSSVLSFTSAYMHKHQFIRYLSLLE